MSTSRRPLRLPPLEAGAGEPVGAEGTGTSHKDEAHHEACANERKGDANDEDKAIVDLEAGTAVTVADVAAVKECGAVDGAGTVDTGGGVDDTGTAAANEVAFWCLALDIRRETVAAEIVSPEAE